jgi:hypothetical protein
MKKKELEEVYWMLEETSKERLRLGGFDANSADIITILSALRSLTIHAIQEHGKYQPRARLPKKASKAIKRK